VFEKGYESAILIGTDIPELSRDVIFSAQQALKKHDAVLGPSSDGGYYLVGFTKSGFVKTIFDGMTWSVNSVLSETCRAMERQSIKYQLICECHDIDTSEDFAALLERIKKGGKTGQRTRKVLKSYER
jgi:glycosyltransferase A (GT-A) superfamily protein (DUF2064 family)